MALGTLRIILGTLLVLCGVGLAALAWFAPTSGL